jgi:subtilisin-like proprotein convertase family protein
VTLAWTDAPGPTFSQPFVNDLDLTVIAGGNTYRGNVFLGAVSAPGGAADGRNTVESVFLPAGLTGPFAVVVTAANIAGDGVPGNGASLDQDFALVVSNATTAAIPVLALEGASVAGDNATIDPNECSDVTLTLRNEGAATATAVSVTLATTTPGATVAQAVSAYPDIPAGGTATNLTPFRISTTPDLVCGTPITLTATVSTAQGMFPAPLHLATGGVTITQETFESTDVPRPIPPAGTSGTTTSTVQVPALAGAVADVDVSLHLTHTWDSDLVISLIAPDGTVVPLAIRQGFSGDDFGASCGARATFDDAAATAIGAGTPPFAGTFRPDTPLAVLNGKSGAAASGAWTLRIEDLAELDVGQLLCWSITINAAEPSCGTGSGPCVPSTFADVPSNHLFWAHVEALAETGITAGCATNPARFCPDSAVTRGQAAVLLLRGIAWPGVASPPRPAGTVFADVAAGHPFAAWIEALFAAGITGGCATSPRRYCPDAGVTRAQMAVFLLKGKHGPGYQPPAPAQQSFGDVPSGHPFAAWIYQLTAEGITSGCGSGNYCPDAPVTRGQLAVFLVRTFNLPL